jgi:hypothetical protein
MGELPPERAVAAVDIDHLNAIAKGHAGAGAKAHVATADVGHNATTGTVGALILRHIGWGESKHRQCASCSAWSGIVHGSSETDSHLE